MNQKATAIYTEKKKRQRRETLFKLAFSAPGFLLYTGLMVLPIFFSSYYSLHKWNGVGKMKFIGLNNYVKLFGSSEFSRITYNTLTLVACSLLITLPAALGIAYLIYRTTRGFKFFRATVFMPSIISPIIIGLIFSILFNADFGPVNIFLESIGLGGMAKAWLSDPSTVLGAVIIPQIWQSVGYYTIIFLAAMQSIPLELLESAEIDGANSFVVFGRIVVPLITNILQIVIILVVTGALKSFGFSWAMTQGGPVVYSSFFTVHMYRSAFIDSNFGMSSAISVNILFYAMTFTLLFKWVCKKIEAFR